MKRVTSKDVADLAGVSRATVSLVLNNRPDSRISEETKEKVREAAVKLNYYPNQIARSLRTNRTTLLGLVLPNISNAYFPLVAQGVEDTARKNGYTTLLCSSFRDPERERTHLQILASKNVDGIILASLATDSGHVTDLIKIGIPIVTFDRRLIGSSIDCVAVDNLQGGKMAVNHLLSLNHRNIGFVSGPTIVTSRQDRYAGYRRALQKAGIPVVDELIRIDSSAENDYRDFNYEFRIGFALARDLIQDNPDVTAIFAVNDMTALGVIKAAQQLGRSVPEDISVIGFDDIPMAEMSTPTLTTLAQPKYEIGVAATDLLISRIEHREDFNPVDLKLFRPKVMVRESCAPLST